MQSKTNGGGGGGSGDGNAATSHNTDRETRLSLGVELAPISPLELLNGGSSGKLGDGSDGDELLTPDPPTVVIDSEDSPPTAKQKRIARVVMAVAFVLLAMCVILVGVTLSMSDHIDDLVRKAQLKDKGDRQPQQHQQPVLENATVSVAAGISD
uniref:Uncharacterized protein n=1 Tax=Macrostomum lignano TaxID=282301 RepID=A0A1I8HAV3_9PLAT